MIWKTSKKRNYSTRCTSFEDLNEDVLRLVLDQVRCNSQKKCLVNVCLVSRQFYALAIPQLYRVIELDFSRMSHRRLLRRLVTFNTHLTRMIRGLGLVDVKLAHHLQLLEVCTLLLKLTNLSQLKWSGTFDVPKVLLESLNQRFPKAALTVSVRQSDVDGTIDIPPPLHTIINLPAISQLTIFQLYLSGNNQLPMDFKNDLVMMLTRSHALRKLYVHAELTHIPIYAEMLTSSHIEELPKLKALWVYVNDAELFTVRELRIWGSKGGWEELTHLYVYHVHHLLTFIGRVPRLNTLYLSPRRQQNINQLGESLHDFWLDAPLGDIKNLSFKGQPVTNGQAHSHTIPWCLLERLPQLAKLDIYRAHFIPNNSGGVLDTPMAQDVREILRLCPDISTLSMDLALKSRLADWPHDILVEVARFEKLESLVFYLHIHDSNIARASVNLFTCFSAFGRIYRERRRMKFPPRQPFEVGFKVVAPWKTMESNWNIPDFRFTSQWRGNVERILVDGWAYREKGSVCLDRLSMEELVEKRGNQFSRWLGFDRHGYKKEIQKRQKDNEAGMPFGVDGTLHDLCR